MVTMNITLSQDPAPEQWGKNAILSANQQGMTIHLQKDPLTTI